MRRLLYLCVLFPMAVGAQFRYDGKSDVRPFSGIPEVAGEFRFAVAADRSGGERPGVFRQGLEQIRAFDPAFIVSVGDQIDGYTTDRAHANGQWDAFESLCGEVPIPFFCIPGNHDYSNPDLAQLWEERLGPNYYSFQAGDCLFLMLNSEEILADGRIGVSDKQADDLISALKRDRNDGTVFVVMHAPLWFADQDPNYRRIERELTLTGRPVTVFSGHTHRYYHAFKNGWPHYNLATMGGDSPMRGVSMGEFDHFMIVDVSRDGVKVRNFLLDGREIPLDVVNEQSRVQVEQLAEEQWLQVMPTVADEERVRQLETGFVLDNRSDIPLEVSFEAPSIPGSCFEPSQFVRTVGAGRRDTIRLRMVFDAPRLISDLEPIVVTCRGRYVIDGREVVAPSCKRWFIDCIRRCGATSCQVSVTDPYYVHESWDWHSVEDGSFSFEVSRDGSNIRLRIETSDDQPITDSDPQQLQDRLIVLYSPEDGDPQRVELVAGSRVEGLCRATCRSTASGLEAELVFSADGVRRFNLNIGFVDCDSKLNTKPSQLWWRPLDGHADYGTFIMD